MKKFLLVLALCLCPALVYADTCVASGGGTILTAASVSYTDVNFCVGDLTSTVTSLVIPQGNATWTSPLTINVPSGSTSLTISGAGSGTTTITDNITSGSYVIQINTTSSTSAVVRLTGLSILGGDVGGAPRTSYQNPPTNCSSSVCTGTQGNVKWNGMLQVNGYSQNFRMDHVDINAQTYKNTSTGYLTDDGNTGNIRFSNCVWGVVDHSTFEIHGTGNAVQVLEGNCYSDTEGLGNQAWAHSSDFGTNEFLFMEDNTFTADYFNSFVNDCMIGGRFVVRHNTMTSAAIQGHATGSGNYDWRGCRAWEVYDNTFNGLNSSTTSYNVAFFPTGTGMVWGNAATASGAEGYKLFLSLVNDRFNGATNYDEQAPPAGWGYNGTSAINNAFGCGSGGDCRKADYVGASNWDGNTNTEGYPAIDQIGRGAGDLIAGSFSTKCDQTLGCSTYSGQWPRQALEPMYVYNNTYSVPSGSGGQTVGLTDATTNLIQANRDYYIDMDSSGNHVAFTGQGGGVGVGLRSARPSPCTPGVAYWSTDLGVLDLCVNNNGAGSWVNAWYTPYSYPHPLVTGGTSGISLTVNTGGSGFGTVAAAGGHVCATGSYSSGTTVECQATANAGSTFTGWTGALSGTSNPSSSFSLTTTSTVTANFSATSSQLNIPNFSPYPMTGQTFTGSVQVAILANGGPAGQTLLYTTDGTMPNDGGSCTAGNSSTHVYSSTLTFNTVGTTTLQAIACAAGYMDSGAQSGSYHVVASGNLGFTVTSANGSLSGTNCASGTNYANPTSITCTETPNSGYVFNGWIGTGSAPATKTAATCSFSMTSNSSLTAKYSIAVPTDRVYLAKPTGGLQLFGANTQFVLQVPTSISPKIVFLHVGSTPGAVDLVNKTIPGNPDGNHQITDYESLPVDGRDLYVDITTSFCDGSSLNWDTVFTASDAALAAITSPSVGTALSGSSVTFTWSAGPAASWAYYLHINAYDPTTHVYTNLVNASITPPTTSYTATGLPTDGRTLYVDLESLPPQSGAGQFPCQGCSAPPSEWETPANLVSQDGTNVLVQAPSAYSAYKP